MTLEQLKELPIGELKALAYDQMAILQQTETNLRTLNQLIAGKSQPEETTVEEIPVEEVKEEETKE